MCCSPPAMARRSPLTGRLGRRSYGHRTPSAGDSGFPSCPAGTWDPRLQTQVYRPVNRSSTGTYPARQAARNPLRRASQRHQPPEVRLIPLAVPPAVTQPLIFHAKYQNLQRFHTGSAAKPCMHAGGHSALIDRGGLSCLGQNERRESETSARYLRQETMSFFRKWRNASAIRTSA